MKLEVDLCGHATLATAHVLFEYFDHPSDVIAFNSPRSGGLSVSRSGDTLTLDFPADTLKEVEVSANLVDALGRAPLKALKGKTDYLLIYPDQQDIEEMKPDFGQLAGAGVRGVIVSAKGVEVDFVSRFFAPGAGINEDPVTGSAHTSLTPYWSEVLGKKKMSARQISERRGDLVCENLGDRVKISGQAVTYMVGEIFIQAIK
ncbi:MAG: PhzF family phenazine biosynthesis protein [Bacteroidales bacterium]|nr:PhzF family phenazine biosynthesis protein [Bacteroidales bacterium]